MLLESEQTIQGAASNIDMTLMYTCQLNKCRIYCPCAICNDVRETCKLLCKDFPCQNCNSQCNKHAVKIPRTFNPEEDLFTLITYKLNHYLHIIPHAGIPASCETCSKDVIEHQILHLVHHSRCRFCRQEMKIFDEMDILAVDDFQNYYQIETIIQDYKRAEHKINWLQDRTCSFCHKLLRSKHTRERHETTIHLDKKDHKFICGKCGKRYANSKDFANHFRENHDKVKLGCPSCNAQFSSKRSLSEHNKVKHVTSTQIQCDECDLHFSKRSHLLRHKKNSHNDSNLNLDFVENPMQLILFSCNHCSEKFKQKSNLSRHVAAMHNEDREKKFICPQCSSKFFRKDNLGRHIKLKHLM